MKFREIVESTTSGSVATVATPIGGTQVRGKGVYPNEKGGNLLKGKKTNAKFANSLSEDELAEQDLILVPGQGHRLKSGFVPHGASRIDHEVEMARSDLFQAVKNARAVHELIKDRSEDEGLEGWVQEKIIKANDYLNSVREYLEGKKMQEAGVIAAGGVGEGVAEGSKKSITPEQMIRDAVEAYKKEIAKENPNPYILDSIRTNINDIKREIERKKQGVAEGVTPASTSKVLRLIQRHRPEWFDTYGIGEVEDTVVDLADMGQFSGMSATDALELVGQELESLYGQQGVAEGAKVDRMVKHIAKSERELGKSKDKAEDIAWATVNKRGYLDNKNKKKGK